MKPIALIICILLTGIATGGEIHVTLANPPAEGTLIFLLYNSANAFGDLREAYVTQAFEVTPPNLYRLTNVPGGTYALVVFQDENGNGLLDKNFIGFPRELIAISNGYRPKGPPRFQRAQFDLPSDSIHIETMTLERILGERGRIGVGAGIVGKSSPYRDYDGVVARTIPTFIYIGERIQFLGPTLQVGLVGTGKTRLAATLGYRMGVYAEEDSPYLQGMGDRRDTAMLGLAVQAELWGGLQTELGYEHDILGQIGGGNAHVSLGKSFQWGVAGLTPSVGVQWLSADLANYDFGVSSTQAQPGRPAYDTGDCWNPHAQLGGYLEITRNWLFVSTLGVQYLENKIRQSPIVSEDYVVYGFFALNYMF